MIDAGAPRPARRYDVWLGGKDNFAADRASAQRIADVYPGIVDTAFENRRFMQRAVHVLAAEVGIRQFLDIGCGFPSAPNVHHVAQHVDPAARVVYVDHDPIVVAHASALMTSAPGGVTAHAQGDLRDPDALIENVKLLGVLDFNQPVAVLLCAVLHLLDDQHAHRAIARLRQSLPAGSHLVITHPTLDPLTEPTRSRLAALAGPDSPDGPAWLRTRAQVAALVNALTLINPGLCPIVEWRPDIAPHPQVAKRTAIAYGVLTRVDPQAGIR